MNKQTFTEILQSAFFSFDGIQEAEIIERGLNPKLVKIGIQLCSYLKSKEINVGDSKND